MDGFSTFVVDLRCRLGELGRLTDEWLVSLRVKLFNTYLWSISYSCHFWTLGSQRRKQNRCLGSALHQVILLLLFRFLPVLLVLFLWSTFYIIHWEIETTLLYRNITDLVIVAYHHGWSCTLALILWFIISLSTLIFSSWFLKRDRASAPGKLFGS